MRTDAPGAGAGGPAGGGPAPAAGRAGPLRAFAELRFRLLWRRLQGRGGIPELVARITTAVVAVPAGLVFATAVGFGAYQAVRAGTGLRVQISTAALFFGVWQTWTAVSLSLSDREMLDLRRFLVYPLSTGRVYAYGVAASVVGDPFTLFWCLLLMGGFGGAAVARPGAWLLLLALVYLAFVVASAALVALLQELLARLLRARGGRALSVAAVYVGVAVVATWSAAGGMRRALEVMRVVRAVRWVFYPPALASEATQALYARHPAAALGWLALLAASAAVTGALAFRLALADARSGAEGTQGRGAAGGTGWPLPGPLGPILEKEAKFLLRHPLTAILALVVPALAGIVAHRIGPHIPAEAGEVVRGLPLLGFAVYAHLATQVFWLNAFGWDRGGARLWFLAPMPPADALRAKNLAAYALSLFIFVACAAVLWSVAGRPAGWALAAGVALHAGIAPWFLAAGNAISVLNPRASSHTVQRGGRLAPASALAGMAIVSAGAALFAVPVLVAIELELPWLLVGAWSGLGLAGALVYRAHLPWLGRLLVARREALLDAVTGDDGG